jgi:hypothetical protein
MDKLGRLVLSWWFMVAVMVAVPGGAVLDMYHLADHAPAQASGQRQRLQAGATTPITHIVIIMMENHTFDNYYGTFPGANGVTLPQAPNPLPSDYGHSREGYIAAIDGGKMDEFPARSFIQYTQSDIPIYWNYAEQFGLGDNFFSSIIGASTPNHLAMIASQTGGLDTTLQQQGCYSGPNNLAYSRMSRMASWPTFRGLLPRAGYSAIIPPPLCREGRTILQQKSMRSCKASTGQIRQSLSRGMIGAASTTMSPHPPSIIWVWARGCLSW